MKFQTYISKSSINYNQQKKFENFLKTIPGVGQKIAKHIAKKFKNMLDILLDTHVKNSFQVYKCITDCKDPL